MTKKKIKENLKQADDILNLDYHDFLKWYSENRLKPNTFPTDYYNIFRYQRSIVSYEINYILRNIGGNV